MTQTFDAQPNKHSEYIKHFAERMRGPGGTYNLGNLIGLVSEISLQVMHGKVSAAESVVEYLIGNASSLWLTVATLVFIVSGEAYFRAWKNGFPPDVRLNWWGDFLSGIGALALGVALFLLGQPILAATAGLLHAFGKFGSAFHESWVAGQLDWPRVFRWLVVFSRMPALGATAIAIAHVSAAGTLMAFTAPVTLLVCYSLWLRADLMLLRGSS